ncbi:MAG: hypothetical protein KKF56_05585 [Nanoarchaeota archaeon]|nr:hypothetical protein [Nanoarchaeota archaeon]
MIEELIGRDKINWKIISDKVNEIINVLNKIEEGTEDEKERTTNRKLLE